MRTQRTVKPSNAQKRSQQAKQKKNKTSSQSKTPKASRPNKQKSQSQSKSKSKKKKNISLPVAFHKIVETIAHPLKTLSKRQHKTEEVDVPFAESRSDAALTTSMKFFYSNDRFIETFDDRDLYESLCKTYPDLHESQKNLQYKRHAILKLLTDEEMVKKFNEMYGMSIFDIISFLFRLCPSLFKGIFVKKVQNAIQSTQYAKKIKKHNYKIAKPKKSALCKRQQKR